MDKYRCDGEYIKNLTMGERPYLEKYFTEAKVTEHSL